MFEIGNSLLEARSRRGVDFVQAELATKIRAKYLRALEEERFEQLPSQTYVKGFLRTYADYLGLDGQLYVDEYNSRFVVGEDMDSRIRRSTVRPERRTRRLETGIVLVALVAVAVVTLVVVSAWQTSGSGAKAPAAAGRTHRVKKHAASQLSAYLQISAVKGPSYVLVHRDGPRGTLLFQGTIGKGRVEPFAGRHFWVSLSSPENLIVIVGGKAIPLAAGKPVVLTIGPSGVHTA